MCPFTWWMIPDRHSLYFFNAELDSGEVKSLLLCPLQRLGLCCDEIGLVAHHQISVRALLWSYYGVSCRSANEELFIWGSSRPQSVWTIPSIYAGLWRADEEPHVLSLNYHAPTATTQIWHKRLQCMLGNIQQAFQGSFLGKREKLLCGQITDDQTISCG